MKNEIGTLEDYMQFIDEKMDDLRKLDGNLPKEEWEEILTYEGFFEKYIVTKTPDILKRFGVDAMIYMSRSNMAYILSRHYKEYETDVYLNIKIVIDNYDLLLSGEQEGNKDYRFYKMFPAINGKEYGVEIVIDRRNESKKEYIVHLNYIGKSHNKAKKLFEKYKKKDELIHCKK